MVDYKKTTIESYNQNAKELSEKFKELTDLKERYEFPRFISLLKGKKILDLGCGSGDHSLYFKEKGLDVISIDLSEEMVNLCNKKEINAHLMDIEHLQFENDSFDGVWAVTSLLHIPKSKLDDVIRRLNLILKDAGILYVCVKEGVGEGLIEDKTGLTKRFFAFWQEEEMKLIFEKHFTLIEISKFKLGNTVFLKAFFMKK